MDCRGGAVAGPGRARHDGVPAFELDVGIVTFFGRDQPSAEFRDRYGKEGRHIRGLTVEQHIARLGEQLLPLAERFSRIMRQALIALEDFRDTPALSVERSAPVVISVASLLERSETQHG